ncbi:glycosyltransferase [Marinobacter sp.]|uniref:glycosyltransferase n=1 Tax=Marinobacter sp. TaxID=50741 RepID=UPI002B272854|nr:glycosyltransferase [Marinobacter sp.]
MKRTVMFCPSKVWGGIEKNVLLRARLLGQQGVAVYVVLLKGFFAERFRDLENVAVVEVGSRGGDLNFGVVANYVRILRQIRPDAVFSALKKDWWLVSLSSRLAGVERVVLYLGIARRVKSPIKFFVIFRIMKAVLMVNSDSLRDAMLKHDRLFRPERVRRIYNGFDLPPVKGPRLPIIESLALPEGSIVIGCAGRFSPQKGFDLLPDLVARLPSNVHFVHVGQGEFEQQITTTIRARPGSERIHFLGYQSDMHAFFRSIDLFLLCSRNEGMANVLNEAMSLGVPVVSTRVPGSEELLDNGRYGVLVNIDDVDAMVDAIKSIIDSEVSFEREALREWIAAEFGMERMIVETRELFFGA